ALAAATTAASRVPRATRSESTAARPRACVLLPPREPTDQSISLSGRAADRVLASSNPPPYPASPPPTTPTTTTTTTTPLPLPPPEEEAAASSGERSTARRVDRAPPRPACVAAVGANANPQGCSSVCSG
uniref:Uncharacterized protein n=1 Tax=Oryza meridionalis TaxID=40149 RepID=A0A0E0BZF1_9ORYZ